ncbi:hypothetical protein PHJA_000549900 [Phtheirospermum japonicum]|uniref:Uncharacterized protein n=1 Tax=Phtheirospermum japonicum TaxID=374723 RepID=A0A830BJ03_9LAMI|nr:hypothetical protein PHJA_000549900 [Phtheirospermum japonicum]
MNIKCLSYHFSLYSKVLNFPDKPLDDDTHLGDDVMSIDPEEDKNDDEMSTITEEEKERQSYLTSLVVFVDTLRGLINEFATEDRVEKHEARMAWVKEDPVLGTDLEDDADVMRFPAIKRFANKLARIPVLVECAKELLKSLNEDGDTVSPNDAFQNLWENETFKKMLVNEYRKDRVKKHEARMAWVKEDPVLGTDLEDDADVMRKVLSLSVLYWMDINLYNIVDLREIVPMEMPDDLTIDYTVEHMHDEEALRKQIDACMGTKHDEAEREVAFMEIRAKQLQCESSLAEGVGVRWLVSYNTLTQSVPNLGVAVTKPA